MKLQNIFLYIIILSLSACSNEPYWPDTELENGTRYSSLDFRFTFECDVTLNLGQLEFVYIYNQDPTNNPNAQAVRTLWTDDYGAYKCRLVLPSALIGQKIYATTSKGVISAEVTEKGAAFNDTSKASRTITVHGDLHPSFDLCLGLKKAYGARMDRFTTDNRSKLVETGEISVHTKEDNTQVLFTFLHSFGWNSNFMYYYYYKGEDPINSENKEKFIDKICNDPQGRFLCTRGWGVQINGHGSDANSPEHDKVTILTTKGIGGINLRFSDIMGSNTGTVDSDTPSEFPHEFKETVKPGVTKTVKSMIGLSNHLYFYGDINLENNDYQYSIEKEMPFPKGYKIGLILKSVRHFDRENLSKPETKNVEYYFTNPSHNTSDIKKNQIHAGRFWASEDAGDFSRFVYGFEDSFNDGTSGKDYNFTDFLCMISTDPMANTADVTSLSATYSAVSGTLLFEDMFPKPGDYDMNDVIAEYRKVKEYQKMDDGKDYIRNFYIELAPVHCGATYDDYLYVNLKSKYADGTALNLDSQLADFQLAFRMKLKSVAEYNERQITSETPGELKTVRIYLIKDWVPYGQSDPVKNLTDDNVKFDDADVFLYVKNTNREVHITGKSCAGVNGSSNDDLDGNLKLYKAPQIVEGKFLPWAMDIPIKSDGHGYRGFIPVTESVMITDEYLRFYDWYNGSRSVPWYENKYHTPKDK